MDRFYCAACKIIKLTMDGRLRIIRKSKDMLNNWGENISTFSIFGGDKDKK